MSPALMPCIGFPSVQAPGSGRLAEARVGFFMMPARYRAFGETLALRGTIMRARGSAPVAAASGPALSTMWPATGRCGWGRHQLLRRDEQVHRQDIGSREGRDPHRRDDDVERPWTKTVTTVASSA